MLKQTLLFIALLACLIQATKVKDTNCVLCEFIVKELEDLISDNSTEQQIVKAIEHVCDILPRTVRPPCKAFIQVYGQQLIQILVDKEPPHTACTQLGLCTSKVKVAKRVVPHPKDNSLCPMCTMFVGMVDSYLAMNSTLAYIETVLHNFPCKFFFKGAQETQCEAFVDSYVPQLINWIENNEDPKTFCTQIGLCGNFEVVPTPKDNSLCPMCTMFIGMAESYLAMNTTLAYIETILHNFPCKFFFKAAQEAQCEAFVDSYVPQLINWIESNEDPKTFCTQVGLCGNLKPLSLRRPNPNDNSLCPMCTMFVGMVDSYLAMNSTLAYIETILHNFPCKFFFKGAQETQCEAFVDSYVPQLINWIENNEDPKTFCTQIGLCGNFVPKVKRTIVDPKDNSLCPMCTMFVGMAESYLAMNTTIAYIETILHNFPCKFFFKASQETQCEAFIDSYVPQLITWITNNEDPKTFCNQVGLCGNFESKHRGCKNKK